VKGSASIPNSSPAAVNTSAQNSQVKPNNKGVAIPKNSQSGGTLKLNPVAKEFLTNGNQSVGAGSSKLPVSRSNKPECAFIANSRLRFPPVLNKLRYPISGTLNHY